MTPTDAVLLFATGAVASGINSVAGGGSLISFPYLTLGMGIGDRVANATNAVGLFPGSFAGGLGFIKQLSQTARHLKTLAVPTILGSLCGAALLLNTSDKSFKAIVPFLILLAALLLWFQPKVKAMLARANHHVIPVWAGIVLQFLVACYGGYFGAGMGIMMLATFALCMDGTTHELNAVKNWLGSIINLFCSLVFVSKGLVMTPEAYPLACGGFAGGFLAARWSLRIDPDKMRRWIAVYGFVMTGYYIWRTTF
jgi:hypothetical protein